MRMRQTTKTFKTIPQTTLRRLRSTPAYFFLIWRWSTWLFAFSIINWSNNPLKTGIGPLLLTITFLQTLLITLYAPFFQKILPQLPGINKLHLPRLRKKRLQERQRRMIWGFRRQHPLAEDEEADLLPPLGRRRNPYKDIFIYGLDVVICGTVTYLGGPYGIPYFGDASPFYRYGFSTAFAAAFAYRYPGGLAAAFGYELFILLGAYFPAPGAPHFVPQIQDLLGSLIDAPLVAILAAYLTTLLENYTRGKRREQDNVRRQQALLRVGETLVTGASDRQQLLQRSAEQIRRGGHFERLVIALVNNTTDEEGSQNVQTEVDTSIDTGPVDGEASLADTPRRLQEPPLQQVVQSRKKLMTFEPLEGGTDEERYGIARLYLPFFKDEQLYLILGEAWPFPPE